jgi:hypothetical protein
MEIPQLNGTPEEQQRQLNYLYQEGFTTIALGSPIVIEIPKRAKRRQVRSPAGCPTCGGTIREPHMKPAPNGGGWVDDGMRCSVCKTILEDEGEGGYITGIDPGFKV